MKNILTSSKWYLCVRWNEEKTWLVFVKNARPSLCTINSRLKCGESCVALASERDKLCVKHGRKNGQKFRLISGECQHPAVNGRRTVNRAEIIFALVKRWLSVYVSRECLALFYFWIYCRLSPVSLSYLFFFWWALHLVSTTFSFVRSRDKSYCHRHKRCLFHHSFSSIFTYATLSLGIFTCSFPCIARICWPVERDRGRRPPIYATAGDELVRRGKKNCNFTVLCKRLVSFSAFSCCSTRIFWRVWRETRKKTSTKRGTASSQSKAISLLFKSGHSQTLRTWNF